jgi:hypothetical protein
MATAEQTMKFILERKSLEELIELQKNIESLKERNLDAQEWAIFTNIIGPII